MLDTTWKVTDRAFRGATRLVNARNVRAILRVRDEVVTVEFAHRDSDRFAAAEAARLLAVLLDTIGEGVVGNIDPIVLDTDPTLQGLVVTVLGRDALVLMAPYFGDVL